MKISGNDEIIKYFNDAGVNRAEEHGKQSDPTETVSQGRDNETVVQLSQRSKEIRLAQQAIDFEPDIRLEKVQDIAARVQAGTYEIDADKVAEKMVAAFFDDLS